MQPAIPNTLNFSFILNTQATVVELVHRLGPVIEAWNKKHDRACAIYVSQMEQEGQTVWPAKTLSEAHPRTIVSNDNLALHFNMTGQQAGPEKVDELKHYIAIQASLNFE